MLNLTVQVMPSKGTVSEGQGSQSRSQVQTGDNLNIMGMETGNDSTTPALFADSELGFVDLIAEC
jgi:hypothetical protein